MKRKNILALALLSIVLVACGNGAQAPAPEVQEPESESLVESSQPADESKEADADKKEDDKEEASESDQAADESKEEDADKEDEDKPASTSSEIVGENDVAFTINIGGEEVGKFVAKDAVGLSVLEAMESIEDLDFEFNEDEGVIDVIDDQANDYDLGETWVYLLNDQMAELGVVSQTLEKGDTIDWYFGTIEDLPVIIIPDEGMEAEDTYEEEVLEDEEDTYDYDEDETEE